MNSSPLSLDLQRPAELVADRSRCPLLGGFECAHHLRVDGVRVDPMGVTHHDTQALEDYLLARELGFEGARDGLRWQQIERARGVYDWAVTDRMLDASAEAGLPILWDLCHWGWPEFIDFWSDDFVESFARFTDAAVERMQRRGAPVGGLVPVNEISFWAWAGGDRRGFAPHGWHQGGELKRQLVRAFLASTAIIRARAPRLPIIVSEPLIVVHASRAPASQRTAPRKQAAMYEAWDMLLGRTAPELGGHEAAFDILGVNWYPANQWQHPHPTLPRKDKRRKRLSDLLSGLAQRYAKPMMLTETGDEEPGGAEWLVEVAAELDTARRAGVDLRGVCVYPIADYPGWENDRHCPCGPIALGDDWRTREVRPDMAAALEQAARLLAPLDR